MFHKMQLFVSLHDHEDVRHSEFVFIFNAKTTLNRLVECIAVRFNIPLLHLKLFTTGGEIIRFHLNWKLSQMNLNHLDNVIVKHDKLVNWVQFLSSLETVKNAKNSRLIKWELDSASQQLPVLVNSKFFLAYVKFDSTPRMFFEEFGNCLYLNSEFKTIEIASKHYFSIILKDNPACPNLQFKCVNKRRARLGLQGGLECHIYEQGQLAKIYHVKIHTKREQLHDNTSCDLRELFAYKLLEYIKIGAIVHFYPNMHNSGFGLYIATEDIPGFRQASEIDEEDPKTKIQLELLSSCLYLRDLKNNNTNYGVDDQGELRIVDFEIHAHKQNSQKIANNFFSRNKQLRFDVGKAAFLSWDLLKNIDLANASIEDQKKLLNKHSITFTVDRNFDDYLTAIKKNVTLIAKYFE